MERHYMNQGTNNYIIRNDNIHILHVLSALKLLIKDLKKIK